MRAQGEEKIRKRVALPYRHLRNVALQLPANTSTIPCQPRLCLCMSVCVRMRICVYVFMYSCTYTCMALTSFLTCDGPGVCCCVAC
jgi:hypothetical protein